MEMEKKYGGTEVDTLNWRKERRKEIKDTTRWRFGQSLMIRVRLVKDFLEEILEKSFFFLLMGFQNIIKKKKRLKKSKVVCFFRVGVSEEVTRNLLSLPEKTLADADAPPATSPFQPLFFRMFLFLISFCMERAYNTW